MSGPIDEAFAEAHVRPGTVLEFGCSPGVFTTRLAARPDLAVTGVDLFEPTVREGWAFVPGDVLDWQTAQRFDTICAVSSLEHCGIDFCHGRPLDLDAHRAVAAKFAALLAPGGRIVATVPFGPDDVWFTRGDLPHVRLCDVEPGDPTLAWGYRTFTVDGLCALFPGLRPVTVEAWEHTDGPYFDRASWRQVGNPQQDAARFVYPHRRGVLCVVMEAPMPQTFRWDQVQRRDDGRVLLLYRHERIFDEGLVKPGARVLDVGGWGMLATRLIEEGCEATILDKFTGDQYYPDRVRTLPHVVGDVTVPETFAPRSFDLVTCFETLEHVGDIGAAVHSVRLWLRRGGWFVGTVPMPGRIHPEDDPACQFITAADLQALLEAEGFKHVLVEPTPSIAVDSPITSYYFKGRKG